LIKKCSLLPELDLKALDLGVEILGASLDNELMVTLYLIVGKVLLTKVC